MFCGYQICLSRNISWKKSFVAPDFLVELCASFTAIFYWLQHCGFMVNTRFFKVEKFGYSHMLLSVAHEPSCRARTFFFSFSCKGLWQNQQTWALVKSMWLQLEQRLYSLLVASLTFFSSLAAEAEAFACLRFPP